MECLNYASLVASLAQSTIVGSAKTTVSGNRLAFTRDVFTQPEGAILFLFSAIGTFLFFVVVVPSWCFASLSPQVLRNFAPSAGTNLHAVCAGRGARDRAWARCVARRWPQKLALCLKIALSWSVSPCIVAPLDVCTQPFGLYIFDLNFLQ